MFIRIFFFLVGFGFTVIGFVYIISYMNLLTIGYKFSEYVHFIFRRIECLYALLGIIFIFVSMLIPSTREGK